MKTAGSRAGKLWRSGRHAAPSPVHKAAQRAGQAAPAVAVMGALTATAGASAVTSAASAPPAAAHPVATAGPVRLARLDAAERPWQRSAPRHAVQADRSYVVQAGDTLAGIAQRYYGHASDWSYLYAVNDASVSDPDLIYVGQVLHLPSRPPASVLNGTYQPRHAAPAGVTVAKAAVAASQATGDGDHDGDDAASGAATGSGPAAPASSATASSSGSQAPRQLFAFPFRSVPNLVWGRVDEGVDFAGDGPVYAIGPGVVTYVSARSGWPGGTFVAYQLTTGAYAGRYVYVAENFTPSVTVGQRVTAATVLGQMHSAYPYIETGWGSPPSMGPTAAAYGHYVEGRATQEGQSFLAWLQQLHGASASA